MNKLVYELQNISEKFVTALTVDTVLQILEELKDMLWNLSGNSFNEQRIIDNVWFEVGATKSRIEFNYITGKGLENALEELKKLEIKINKIVEGIR